MCATALFSSDEIRQLRAEHYDGQVVDVVDIHEDLKILRVRPDEGTPSFSPGQYCVLGLGDWEPRVAGCQTESLNNGQEPRLLKRASDMAVTPATQAVCTYSGDIGYASTKLSSRSIWILSRAVLLRE